MGIKMREGLYFIYRIFKYFSFDIFRYKNIYFFVFNIFFSRRLSKHLKNEKDNGFLL